MANRNRVASARFTARELSWLDAFASTWRLTRGEAIRSSVLHSVRGPNMFRRPALTAGEASVAAKLTAAQREKYIALRRAHRGPLAGGR